MACVSSELILCGCNLIPNAQQLPSPVPWEPPFYFLLLLSLPILDTSYKTELCSVCPLCD